VPYHCDAVQAVGKLPMKIKDLPIDYLSITGHKFGAPKGIGALYV
jgi:cysteine desulfurase